MSIKFRNFILFRSDSKDYRIYFGIFLTQFIEMIIITQYRIRLTLQLRVKAATRFIFIVDMGHVLTKMFLVNGISMLGSNKNTRNILAFSLTENI